MKGVKKVLKNGFIIIDRSITQWRWYHDANTFRVFFHLMLTANYEDKDFENITVKRGERVISYSKLAVELSLSERNVRTAIKHLKETGEVTVRAYRKFSVITVNNYDEYQAGDRLLTDNRQASDRQVTLNRQASDNNETKINKDKQSNKDKQYISSPDKSDGVRVSFSETKKNKPPQSQLEKDFEECWKIYPKKEGKAEAKRAYIRFAGNDPDLKAKVISGIRNYLEEIRITGKNYQFIQKGSTYFRNEHWNDEYIIKENIENENNFRSRNSDDEPF